MIRILLADDHKLFLDGMKSILQDEQDIQIVGAALNGIEVLEIMEQKTVDVVILDIRMPEMDGEKTITVLKKKYPQTKVIILTMHDRPEHILKFINKRADGYILKNRSKEELIGAIHAVYKNNSYYPPSILNKITEATYSPEEDIRLTKRELQILSLVSKGLRDKEIASKLSIAETTVITHCRNLRKKIGVSNRTELANYAKDKDLI